CFVLRYDNFLPPSVFPRFIVKVHKDIKDKLCWRTGVLLEDQRSGTQAVVKSNQRTNRIDIWVHGPRRKEYLNFLWYSLLEINSSFDKLDVKEGIPLSDKPLITADYSTLVKYAARGIDIYYPEGSDKEYSVKELLGLVVPEGKEELFEYMKNIQCRLEGKESTAEVLNSLVEPKINLFGITFDLSSLFEGIRSKVRDRVLDDPSREDKNE
ncbi:hypothetical protein VU05_05500, partial [Desulfobulbus sp. F1]|nr:hypothetical protein [Desulfobulbus sp. F1]